VLNGNRRLWWLGGEGGGDDPRSQTEDLGDNSMKASEYGIKNLKRIMENLEKWTQQDNDQYDDLEEMWNEVRGQFWRYTNHVLRNIGGAYLNTPGKEPRSFVPKEIQREAVQYLGRNIFDAPEWLFSKNISNKVRFNPTYAQDNMQERVIGRMLDGYTLITLNTNAVACEDGYTVPEYLDDLFVEVWKPLNNSNEWKNEMRRNLERIYISQINALINPDDKVKSSSRISNYDVTLYVMQHLDKIEQYLKQQQAEGINALHYQDLLERITQIRERRNSPLR
jgi:hypothetical protein